VALKWTEELTCSVVNARRTATTLLVSVIAPFDVKVGECRLHLLRRALVAPLGAPKRLGVPVVVRVPDPIWKDSGNRG
jgi:hypothetical protein